MTDQQEILKLLRDQDEAVAQGDAEAVVAPIGDGYVSFDLPPPLKSNGDARQGIESLNAWFGTWEDGVTVNLTEPTVIVEGGLAVVHGLSRMQGVKKGDGPLDAWNRRTVVLQRQEGKWKIVHEHSSYPTAMDGSRRSMTELKP